MNIRHAHVDAGFIHPRGKRAFSEIDEADSEPAEASVPNTDSSDFNKLACRLVRDSETTEGDDDGNNRDLIPTICVPPRPQQSNPQNQDNDTRHSSSLLSRSLTTT
jgi:hypothetical protein